MVLEWLLSKLMGRDTAEFRFEPARKRASECDSEIAKRAACADRAERTRNSVRSIVGEPARWSIRSRPAVPRRRSSPRSSRSSRVIGELDRTGVYSRQHLEQSADRSSGLTVYAIPSVRKASRGDWPAYSFVFQTPPFVGTPRTLQGISAALVALFSVLLRPLRAIVRSIPMRWTRLVAYLGGLSPSPIRPLFQSKPGLLQRTAKAHRDTAGRGCMNGAHRRVRPRHRRLSARPAGRAARHRRRHDHRRLRQLAARTGVADRLIAVPAVPAPGRLRIAEC